MDMSANRNDRSQSHRDGRKGHTNWIGRSIGPHAESIRASTELVLKVK